MDTEDEADYAVDSLSRFWRSSLLIMLVGGCVIGVTFFLDGDLSEAVSRPLVVTVAIGCILAFLVLGAVSLGEDVRRMRSRRKGTDSNG